MKPGISDNARWIFFITLVEVLILSGVAMALWKMC